MRTKVRITKSEISMRTWRSPMSATSQGAFVVIPEISLCDISSPYNQKTIRPAGASFLTHARRIAEQPHAGPLILL